MTASGQFEVARVKSLFRIGEVSRLTDTKPFVLRYWETEFPMLQPVKSAKGHRLYRREDVDTVLHIKRLLYDEGFTIAGARRHLRDGGAASSPVTGHAIENGQDSERATIEVNDAPEGPIASGHLSAADSERSAEAGSARVAGRGATAAAGDISSVVSRKVLLDLRDALRSFLTVLESE